MCLSLSQEMVGPLPFNYYHQIEYSVWFCVVRVNKSIWKSTTGVVPVFCPRFPFVLYPRISVLSLFCVVDATSQLHG